MKRAFTLIEVLLASLAMLFVASGFVALCVAAARSYASTTTRSDVQVPVGQAMAHIARDLQEAKTATVTSAYQLTITLPTTNADGSYNRNVLDSANAISYFRADASNNPSATGTFLVRRVGTGTVMRMVRRVTNVVFNADLAGSIEITIGATSSAGVAYTVSERSTYMRNN